MPIRMSALVEFLRARWELDVSFEEGIAELRAEAAVAGSWCPRCEAKIDDPIVIRKADENRMAFICPACAPPELRKRWEAEAPR